jgi:hypothetical protein
MYDIKISRKSNSALWCWRTWQIHFFSLPVGVFACGCHTMQPGPPRHTNSAIYNATDLQGSDALRPPSAVQASTASDLIPPSGIPFPAPAHATNRYRISLFPSKPQDLNAPLIQPMPPNNCTHTFLSPHSAWRMPRQAGQILRLALVGAALHVVGQPEECTASTTSLSDSIFIVYSSFCGADVQARLRGTGVFSTVNTFDAASSTPMPSPLAAYYEVLVNWYLFNDAVALGDHYDEGAGVVVAFNANSVYGSLKGKYGTANNSYALLNYTSGDYIYSQDSLGNILEQESLLVSSFSSSVALRSTATVISRIGIVVARLHNGGVEALDVRGSRGGSVVVELDFGLSKGYGDGLGWTGDDAALLWNAFNYLRCLLISCGPWNISMAGVEACCPRRSQKQN